MTYKNAINSSFLHTGFFEYAQPHIYLLFDPHMSVNTLCKQGAIKGRPQAAFNTEIIKSAWYSVTPVVGIIKNNLNYYYSNNIESHHNINYHVFA